MTVSILFMLWKSLFPEAPVPETMPDLVIVAKDPGNIRVRRRSTNRSRIIYVETFAGADVYVNGVKK